MGQGLEYLVVEEVQALPAVSYSSSRRTLFFRTQVIGLRQRVEMAEKVVTDSNLVQDWLAVLAAVQVEMEGL
jgi:hypothetical protein